jgi:hypothetical protein
VWIKLASQDIMLVAVPLFDVVLAHGKRILVTTVVCERLAFGAKIAVRCVPEQVGHA